MKGKIMHCKFCKKDLEKVVCPHCKAEIQVAKMKEELRLCYKQIGFLESCIKSGEIPKYLKERSE